MSDLTKKQRWDERYGSEDYFFGTEPNDFLMSATDQLAPESKVLCLADGEGRNGVYLAELGHRVTSVDQSVVGLEKAKKLAANKRVPIETIAADLTNYDLGSDQWDAVVSVFFHIPAEPRARIYQRVERALKPGGLLILESYTPDQLRFRTGGPPVADLMMTKAIAHETFPALTFEHCEELERDVIEGSGHTGRAAVLQVIARR